MISLEKNVQKLIINGTLINQPGLFYGKTGIAVFFLHYARQTGNELFQDYAIDLIDEIRTEITSTISVRYDVGLAGIGTGFEYLLQNGFLDAEDSDIFENFDARMYRAAMYEPYPDLSLQEGLTGWGRYFIYRLRGSGNKKSKLHKALTHIAREIRQKIVKKTVSENEMPDVYRFFYDLTNLPEYADKYCKSLKQCKKSKNICDLDITKTFLYMNELQRLYVCQNYFDMDLSEEIGQEWEKWEKTSNNLLTEMGLLKGVSYNALLQLTRLNENNASWFNLL